MTHTTINRSSKINAYRRLFHSLSAALRTLAECRRDARLLSTLGDHQLRDIGLRRDQVSENYSSF